MTFGHNQALIIIDMQNDFCPEGSLAVPDGDTVVDGINRLLNEFRVRVFTQDWHPPDHSSFAGNHSGRNPFDTVELPYGTQVLWPDHCVQGSRGAEFHPRLNTGPADIIIRKGFRAEIDSYSAFFENDMETPTGLEGYLRTRGVDHVVCVGLATDFCVRFSAVDAVRLGFSATVYEDGCRAIDLDGSLAEARSQMLDVGVVLESWPALPA